MKLIVGLGNPGSKYRGTKHNIGFIALDEIAYQEKVEFNKTQFEADTAEFFLNGEKIILAKPQTFMNESGRSIRPLMDYYNLSEEDILVIYDDLDLPIGRIRLREKGSAEIQAIGAGALNQAIKAIAIARGFVAPSGKNLICIPAFSDITIEGEERTAIKLIVEAR